MQQAKDFRSRTSVARPARWLHFLSRFGRNLFFGILLLFSQSVFAQTDDECGSFSNILTAKISVIGAAANSTGPYCLGQTIQLVGMGGDSYEWKGPNGFSSTQQSPIIANGQFVNAGTYRLTVWDTLGCTDVTFVKITFKPCVEDCQNTLDDDLDGLTDCLDPDCKLDSLDISIVGDSVFCDGGSSQLTASKGVSWLWSTGATNQTILANSTGNFKVTATNAKGCTAVDSFSIKVNPNPIAAASIGGLICEEQTIRFAASGGTFYHWTGPNGLEMHRDTFDLTYLKVVQGGVYQVVVQNSQGCADTVQVPVPVGFKPSGAIANGGLINCQNTCINLQGSSTVGGATYAWSGPNGFSSTQQNPKVCEVGTYSLTVTDPGNNCFSVDTAYVFRNDTAFSLSCTIGAAITCEKDTITLKVDPGLEDNYHISISGPNGFLSHSSQPEVWEGGNYQATVTSLITGCQVTCEMSVAVQKDAPIAVASAEKLTCNGPGCQLYCNASQPGVKYFWTGPGGFASAEQNPIVYQLGMYYVKVKGIDNKCFSDEKAVEVKME